MENISQMSLLEVALKIMEEKGGVVNIYDLINEVLALKGQEDPDNTLATQLYVDITTSSKFVYMGEDNWDLKSRQSLDQFDKDGASFNPKDGSFEEDEEDETDEDDSIDEEKYNEYMDDYEDLYES